MADNNRKIPFIKEIWNSRKLIVQLARNDFKTKYAGSYFGIIWAFIQPIITIMIYVFVFGMGLKMTPQSTEYPFLLSDRRYCSMVFLCGCMDEFNKLPDRIQLSCEKDGI